jgi:hypothetical protein
VGSVEPLRVDPVDVAHRLGKIARGRPDEQVVVVSHEAVRMNLDPESHRSLGEQAKEPNSIFGGAEDRATFQAAVGDVVPGAGKGDAKRSRHGRGSGGPKDAPDHPASRTIRGTDRMPRRSASATSSGPPESDVVIRPFEGGEERVLVEGATVPVFSPDGRMLAFAGGRTPSGRIGVVAVDGGEPRWLTTSGTWPTWMPDGREIAYADRTSEGPQVARAVSIDGGKPRAISPDRWPETNFPFSIDPRTGRILTTNMGDANSSLWLAEYD